jgi:hypothetical protein
MKNSTNILLLVGVGVAGYLWYQKKQLTANSQQTRMTQYTDYNPNAAPGTPGSLPAGYKPPEATGTGFIKYELDKLLNVF